jgi:hypothetical protein
MVMYLTQAVGGSPEPYLVGAILTPVLFVSWVIASKRRTRRLVLLIRATRRRRVER